MLKFHAHILISRVTQLAVAVPIFADDPKQKLEVIRILELIRESCSGLDLSECVEKSTRAIEYVQDHFNKPDGVRALAADLKADIDAALAKRVFLFVKKGLTDFIDNPILFGKAVATAFPDARFDIQEAGNCLAADCSTAAVFHLMRVAEYGLRALANDRRVTVPKGILELATWEDILRELENAEAAIQRYPKTLAREAQFDFYHGANMEFKRFKNKFRNQIMHTRDSYDDGEA